MKSNLSRLTLTFILIVALCCLFALPLSAAEITDANSNLGTGALIPDEEPEYQAPVQPRMRAGLPSSVDLSTEKYFPVIDSQGSLGSCSSWSTTYYAFTYAAARLNDWDAKNNAEYVFSPKWTYNYLNTGRNVGTSIAGNLDVLKISGAARWSEFNYSERSSGGSDWLAWCNDLNIARKALNTRISNHSYVSYATSAESTPITGPNSPALTNMKTLLNNKNPLVFQTSWQWQYKNTDDYGYVVTRTVESADHHALCIVGYDDNVTYDLNENGTIEDFEHGAFKVANSHGKYYRNNGYVWIMYDSLNKVSNAENLNSYNRESVLYQHAYYRFDVAIYTPSFTAEITVDTASRGDIGVTIGRWDDVDSVTPSTALRTHYYRSGGEHPFLGAKAGTEGTMLVDMDAAVGNTENWLDHIWYVNVEDLVSNEYTTTVKSIKLIKDDVVILDSAPNDSLNGSGQVYYYPTSNIEPTSFSLSPTSRQMYTGYTTMLKPTFLPSNTTQKMLTWSSSDESLATVDNRGMITAKSPGKVTITATTVNGLTASSDITMLVDDYGNTFDTAHLIALAPWGSAKIEGELEIYTDDKADMFKILVPVVGTLEVSITNKCWTQSSLYDATGKLLSTASNRNPITFYRATREPGQVFYLQVSPSANQRVDRNSYSINVSVKPTDVSSLWVEPNPVSVDRGKTTQLTAMIYPDYATNKTITWTSSNNSIATVDANGVVTGVRNGTANITAMTVNGKTAICKVTVVTPTIAVEEVTVTPATATVNKGATLQLTGTVIPSDATKKTLTWSSSDTSVATVTSAGRVTGRAAGAATITATSSNGKTATSTITVIVPINPTGISLDYTTKSLYVGSTAQLMATIAPSNATNTTVTWTSSRTSVATVSDTGLISGQKAGTATITARTANGRIATCRMTVYVDDYDDTFDNAHPLTVQSNKSHQVKGMLEVADEEKGDMFRFTAPVSGFYTIAAKATADPSVYACLFDESEGRKYLTWDPDLPIRHELIAGNTYYILVEYRVPVDQYAYTLNIYPPGTTVEATGVKLSTTYLIAPYKWNGRVPISATFTPSNTTNKAMTWTSSNPSVATVSGSSIFYWGATGSTTLTGTTVNGLTASCKVVITAGTPVRVTAITVSPERVSIAQGETHQLTTTTSPTNASDKDVTWSTSNPKVAVVNDTGVVTAVGRGTATITAKSDDGGKRDTCRVTVTKP